MNSTNHESDYETAALVCHEADDQSENYGQGDGARGVPGLFSGCGYYVEAYERVETRSCTRKHLHGIKHTIRIAQNRSQKLPAIKVS